jgi:hypothetical protein
MKILSKKLLFISLLLGPGLIQKAFTQEPVQLTVEAPKVVTAGEVFRLAYTINAKAESFNGPKIEGFLFNGPMLSSSMSTQIINSQVTQSVRYTYNYTLQATQEGVFTIPGASSVVNGKNYSCNPVKIEVLKSGASGGQQADGQAGNSNDGLSGEDLFVKVEVDRSNVYKGEQIIATIRIYSRVNLARFGEIKMPDFAGFWNQEIPTPAQVNLERINYQGKLYNVGVLRRSVLIPQQTGKISIDPFEIECMINAARKNQRSPFGDMFGDSFFGSYETLSKKISSPRVEITVKPFPPNPPAGFTGAVGKYSVQAGLDKNEVSTNEAVTLKVVVKGSGNIKLLELPPFQFPADLELYDPKITDNIEPGNNGIMGSKTFEYVIVPRHAGDFEIPAWTFSYFDPAAGDYREFVHEAMKLTVKKGVNDSEATIISTPGKEDIRIIGQDIRFIKTDNPALQKIHQPFFGSMGFWLSYLAIFLLFILMVGYIRNKFKNESDIEGMRFRKAIAVSRKQLAEARHYLNANQSDRFLEALLKSLWGYIGNKFNLNLSELNRDSITDLLFSKGVEQNTISGLIETIDSAEYLRYAPGTGEGDFQHLLQKAEEFIVLIEKSYRR